MELIECSQPLAAKIVLHKNEILKIQQALSLLGILSFQENKRTTSYIIDLINKSSEVKDSENYLRKPHYTYKEFEETYVKFNQLIDLYVEVLFEVSLRISKINQDISLKDCNDYMKSILSGIEYLDNSTTNLQSIRAAIDNYDNFTSYLRKQNLSVLYIIGTGVNIR